MIIQDLVLAPEKRNKMTKTLVLAMILAWNTMTVQPAMAQMAPEAECPASATTATQNGWGWPSFEMPSLASITSPLPLSLASFSVNLPSPGSFSEALASGVIDGLTSSIKEIASGAFAAARSDLEKHATWDYKVIDLDNKISAEETQTRLAALGKEKWELVNTLPIGNKTRLILKKPGISLLRAIAPILNRDD